jgi:hypothetical protein
VGGNLPASLRLEKCKGKGVWKQLLNEGFFWPKTPLVVVDLGG